MRCAPIPFIRLQGMTKNSSIRVWKVVCCAVAAASVVSCTDPPEMLEIQNDTERLKKVVKESREELQQVSDSLRALQMEKRAWDKDTELETLNAEVEKLRGERDAAKAGLSKVEEEFETMKQTRLP